MKRVLIPVLLAYALIGCSSAKSDLGKNIEVTTGSGGELVSGFNEPNAYENGIGVRAVARQRLLMISIHNNTSERIFVEPPAFRLLTPDRQLYEFQLERDEMSGFLPREMQPGEKDLFSVGVSKQVNDLASCRLIFNYPPQDAIIVVPVEQIRP